MITEDWFFRSHFLPMARAAQELGLSVSVATRVRSHGAAIESADIEVIPLDEERGRRGLSASLRIFMRLRGLLRQQRPDIVHLVSLRPVVLGGLAARLAGIAHPVYAITGQGFLGAAQTVRSRIALAALRLLARWVLDRPRAHFIFENEDDQMLFAPSVPRSRTTIVGGAGVDPAVFVPTMLPPMPPLRVAVIARMIWQKGIDIAVEAVERARKQGVAVELSLFGAPDLANPRTFRAEELEAWGRRPGIAWCGRTDDVPRVWAEHHVCCLPSRGGEGLPRALLEAAACGRAIVTTNVPGCRTFVRDGVDGLVVPVDDADRLTEAFVALAGNRERVARMGEEARARVLQGFSEDDVAAKVRAVYSGLLTDTAGSLPSPVVTRDG